MNAPTVPDTHAIGLSLVKQAGGVTIVQDPDDAEAPTLPLNAMRQVAVDYALPVDETARAIMGVLSNSPPRGAPRSGRLKNERRKRRNRCVA